MNDRALSVFREKLAELELHNPARKGHGERVSSHAVAVAHTMGVNDEELVAVRIASALHDYGKTRIHREILERSSPIDSQEIVEIRARVAGIATHVAHEIGVPSVADAIGWQYERFDGLGFPGNTKGKEIHLSARIVAVCAAYDVMTHDQPWKHAKLEDEALADLNRNSGTQFDPEVVAAFLSIQPLITPVEF